MSSGTRGDAPFEPKETLSFSLLSENDLPPPPPSPSLGNCSQTPNVFENSSEFPAPPPPPLFPKPSAAFTRMKMGIKEPGEETQQPIASMTFVTELKNVHLKKKE